MSYISETVNKIKNYIRKRQMVILESTIYPGATEEFFLPILHKKKRVSTQGLSRPAI